MAAITAGALAVAGATGADVWVATRPADPVPPRVSRLSPDGTRVAVEVRDQEWDVWIANVASTTFWRSSGQAA